MNIAAATLVAFTIFDVMPQIPVPFSVPVSTYATTGTGELLVTVNSGGASGSIPRGATRVELAVLNLSASCDADIKVTSIDVQHSGLGNTTDIQSVYLSDGTRRISRAASFDSHSRIATLRLKNSVIPKCSAVRYSVLVDMSPTATVGSEHGVIIPNSSSVLSSAKTTTLQTEDVTEKVVPVAFNAGKITVNFLPIHNSLRYGFTETVARIQLTVDNAGPQLLKKITLTNTEQAHDMDLINFQLQTQSGTVISVPAQHMKADKVTLEISPSFRLERGQTIVLLLKAEIHGSYSRKINFTLQERGDLYATPARTR